MAKPTRRKSRRRTASGMSEQLQRQGVHQASRLVGKQRPAGHVCIEIFALAHLFKNRWCQVGCRRNRGFILCVLLYDVYTYLKYMIKRMPSSYNVCGWVGLLTSIPCPSAQLGYLELGVQGPLCRLDICCS